MSVFHVVTVTNLIDFAIDNLTQDCARPFLDHLVQHAKQENDAT